MSLRICFTDEGRKALQRLHIDFQRRIKRALKQLAENSRLGRPLVGPLLGFHALPEGNYRVIYSVDGKTLTVHTVGHRRTVYDSLKRDTA